MGLVLGSKVVVVLYHLGHHPVVAGKAYGDALKREIGLREVLLTEVHHLYGLFILSGIYEGVGNGKVELPLAHNAKEGVVVLVVYKPAAALKGIPLVLGLHVLIELQGVHLAGIRRGNLVLDGSEAVRETIVHEVILYADIEVSALVQDIDGPVPIVAVQEVQKEDFRLGKVVLVL